MPSNQLSVDPRSGVTRRHHADEKGVQRAMRKAAWETVLVKPATPHTPRHSFATQCDSSLASNPQRGPGDRPVTSAAS